MLKISSLKTCFVFTFILFTFCSLSFSYDFAGGTGEPNDPYQIETAAQLLQLGSDPNLLDKCFILNNDIDLDPDATGITPFTKAPIAPDIDNSNLDFDGTSFTGIFDGNNFSIASLIINVGIADNDFLGLFGHLGQACIVKNLGMENVSVIGGSSSQYLGGLCGWNGGTITNCYAAGNVSGESLVGGLCGYHWRGTVTNCYATGNVSGNNCVGGLCGSNWYNSVISNCYATGTILGSDNASSIGGFCGTNFSTISNCYARGDVSSGNDSSNIGGFCGENTTTFTIISCYSTGAVSAGDNSSNIGGLCGDNTYGTVINSYWDVNTSGQTSSHGGTGKTTTEMQTQNTFIDWD